MVGCLQKAEVQSTQLLLDHFKSRKVLSFLPTPKIGNFKFLCMYWSSIMAVINGSEDWFCVPWQFPYEVTCSSSHTNHDLIHSSLFQTIVQEKIYQFPFCNWTVYNFFFKQSLYHSVSWHNLHTHSQLPGTFSSFVICVLGQFREHQNGWIVRWGAFSS